MARSSNSKTKRSEFLRELLRRDNLKWNWDSISTECVAEPKHIPDLLEFCTDKEMRVRQNAGAVLGKIIDLDQGLLIPHLPKLLEILKTEPHDAVKRATMRVLQTIEIPEAIEGEVFDVAMRFLSDENAAIAIRAYSVTIARRFCQRYPPLRHELLPVIKQIIEHGGAAAILSRARKDLKLLEALSDDDNA